MILLDFGMHGTGIDGARSRLLYRYFAFVFLYEFVGIAVERSHALGAAEIEGLPAVFDMVRRAFRHAHTANGIRELQPGNSRRHIVVVMFAMLFRVLWCHDDYDLHANSAGAAPL